MLLYSTMSKNKNNPESEIIMSEGLDVIIVDDDPVICENIAEIINKFYTWGNVYVFNDVNEASIYCLNRDSSIAIFIVDVFLNGKSGFLFLDTIAKKFTSVYEDTIMMTGNASDEVVDMCVASNIHHLLEKPIRHYVLQLAVRSLISKYTRFASRLLENPDFSREFNKILKSQVSHSPK